MPDRRLPGDPKNVDEDDFAEYSFLKEASETKHT